VLFLGYNLELTIGLQGLGPVPQGVRWGRKKGVWKALTPSIHTWDK
jgi:hypothetical protein